jgi:hypothetical protein
MDRRKKFTCTRVRLTMNHFWNYRKYVYFRNAYYLVPGLLRLSWRLIPKRFLKVRIQAYKIIILPVLLYVCECGLLFFSEEHKQQVSESKVFSLGVRLACGIKGFYTEF